MWNQDIDEWVIRTEGRELKFTAKKSSKCNEIKYKNMTNTCDTSNATFPKDINIAFENISYTTKVGLFRRCKYKLYEIIYCASFAIS